MPEFAGYKLTNLREAKGWDQRTLAERSGISKSVISALESGKTANPRPHTVRALCDALECAPGAVLKRGRFARTADAARAPRQEPARDVPAERAGKLANTPTLAHPTLFPAPAEQEPPYARRRITMEQADRMVATLPYMWRRVYTTCTEAGFDREQAMQLLTTAITAGVLP